MREIDAETAADYLRESGRVPEGAEVHVRELSGGVSNIVLRVDFRASLRSSSSNAASGCGSRWTGAPRSTGSGPSRHTRSAPRDPARGNRPPGLVRGPAELPVRDDLRTRRRGHLEDAVDGGPGRPEIAARLGTILGTIHADGRRHPALQGPWPTRASSRSYASTPTTGPPLVRHPDLAPRIDALDRRHGPARGRANARPGRLQPQEHPGALRRPDPARLRMCATPATRPSTSASS